MPCPFLLSLVVTPGACDISAFLYDITIFTVKTDCDVTNGDTRFLNKLEHKSIT